MKRIAILFSFLFLAAGLILAEGSFINNDGGWCKVGLSAESGFLTVGSHNIQFGNAGTQFDYKQEGKQDVLFPFLRMSAELRLFDAHSIIFLYQPLDIVTDAVTKENTVFYNTTFAAGTPLNVRYGFSFYRASYTWYFLKDGFNEFGAGLSMQIRNASIIFKAVDGSATVINQNVGPVPILRIAGKYGLDNGLWFGMEADGFYASSSFFNGAKFPFEGAIWDASVRAGLKLKNGINPFINFRCLGGGARGTSKYEEAQGDGYTRNWLNTYSVTLGILID